MQPQRVEMLRPIALAGTSVARLMESNRSLPYSGSYRKQLVALSPHPNNLGSLFVFYTLFRDIDASPKKQTIACPEP